jgi:hypothetical protein
MPKEPHMSFGGTLKMNTNEIQIDDAQWASLRNPTAAQLLDDAVVGDGLADHRAEILGPMVEQVNEASGIAIE